MSSFFTLRRFALAAVILSLGMSRGALAQVQSILTSPPSASINAIVFDPTGAMFVGGNFKQIGGQVRTRVTKLTPNVDGTFSTVPTTSFADPGNSSVVARVPMTAETWLPSRSMGMKCWSVASSPR